MRDVVCHAAVSRAAVVKLRLTLAVDSVQRFSESRANPFNKSCNTVDVLAILGLRALYFLLRAAIDRLRSLNEGLGNRVLVFLSAENDRRQWRTFL